MNLKTTLILAIIAALAGVYIYLVEIKGVEKKEAAAEEAKLVFKIDNDAEISTVTIKNATTEIELTRSGDEWKITKPIEANADKTAADAVINELKTAKSKVVIDDAGDLKEFGLEPPAIHVTAKKGNENITLDFGDESPIDSSIYARADKGKVITLDSYSKTYFAKTLLDFRDKTVIKIDKESDIRKLVVKKGEDSVTFEASPGGDTTDWELTAPIKADADDEKVSDMVRELKYMKALSFRSAYTAPRLGLDTPDISVEVYVGESMAKLSASFSIQGEKAFALNQSILDIMEIGPAALDNFSAKPDEFIERRVSRFDRFEAEMIRVASAESGELELKRKDDGSWEFSKPAKDTALDSGVSDLLSGLENLEAIELPQITPKDAGIGSIKYSILDKDEKVIAEILVGKKVEGKGVYVKNANKPQVFLVPEGTKFYSTVDDFKSSAEPQEPLEPPFDDPIESPPPQ